MGNRGPRRSSNHHHHHTSATNLPVSSPHTIAIPNASHSFHLDHSPPHHHHRGNAPHSRTNTLHSPGTQTLGRMVRSTSQTLRDKMDVFKFSTLQLQQDARANRQRRRTDTERTITIPTTAIPVPSAPRVKHLAFMAIIGYTSRGFGDLTFLKEEKFLIYGQVSDNGWWYGESQATGDLGFFPESLLAPLEQSKSLEWYHSREDACIVETDLHLPKNPNGTFFISPCQTQLGCYELLVLDDREVHRYRICHIEDDLRWFVDTTSIQDYKFASLDSLVLYFSQNYGLTTRLTQPCPRMTGKKWFFGQMARQTSERMLLRFGTKKGTFLVRESDTQPGVYALCLYDGEQVRHYRIRRSDNGGFFIGPNLIFRNLDVMLDHYREQTDGLVVTLADPCSHCALDTLEDSASVYQELLPTCDKWEIDRATLHLHTRLGSGHFGEVWAGVWNDSMEVAVKMLKPDSMSPREFLSEAQVMKKLQHPKLVRLHAVCTREEPIYIVTELMKKGSLLKFLQTDEGKKLPPAELVDIASQVASGMAYLEAQKYIHRDLAARNILVSSSNEVKIADFGLTRIISDNNYHAKQGTRLPIRWTAPEAIFYNCYSIKSDVWSFGIFIMELTTGGQGPYQGMCKAEVLTKLQQGYRMPKPRACPQQLYDIVLQCWIEEPEDRPTFEYLKYHLEDYFVATEEHTYLAT